MATTVYTVEEVELQDGSTVTLRPLSIKGMRKFMERMEEFPQAETNDEGLEVLLDAASICLMKERPDFWDKDKDRGKKEYEREVTNPRTKKKTMEKVEEDRPRGGYTEEAEDVYDMPTVYHILNVCGGIDLQNPQMLAAAQAAIGQTSTSQD